MKKQFIPGPQYGKKIKGVLIVGRNESCKCDSGKKSNFFCRTAVVMKLNTSSNE